MSIQTFKWRKIITIQSELTWNDLQRNTRQSKIICDWLNAINILFKMMFFVLFFLSILRSTLLRLNGWREIMQHLKKKLCRMVSILPNEFDRKKKNVFKWQKRDTVEDWTYLVIPCRLQWKYCVCFNAMWLWIKYRRIVWYQRKIKKEMCGKFYAMHNDWTNEGTQNCYI